MKFLHRDAVPIAGRLVQIAFTGKGLPRVAPEEFGAAVGALLPEGVEPAWARQVHSADVVAADLAGVCGPADALVTSRAGLGLVVVTADCVPVLLAGADTPADTAARIAAVHAGWRGLVAGVVGEAVDRFETPPATAWIGPAISAAVYEVGPEVAGRVAEVSDESVVSLGPSGREHVDLRRAVDIQLRRLGVEDVRHVERCTFRDEALWSYRRDGSGAWRNLSVIWIEP